MPLDVQLHWQDNAGNLASDVASGLAVVSQVPREGETVFFNAERLLVDSVLWRATTAPAQPPPPEVHCSRPGQLVSRRFRGPMSIHDMYIALQERALPHDVAIRIDDDLDPRIVGRYLPEFDRIEIRSDCQPYTILHEGAHAEHWRSLTVNGNLRPSLPFRIGAALASEVYVGRRLAHIPWYPAAERDAASTINSNNLPPTFLEVAESFVFPSSFNTGSTRLTDMLGFGFIMRLSTLLGVELELGQTSFFAALPQRTGLTEAILDTMRQLSRLTRDDFGDEALLESFGSGVINQFQGLGVPILDL